VGGGTENTNFRVSANYRNKTAIDIATQRKEYGLRASFQQRAINNLLQLDGNVALPFRGPGNPGPGPGQPAEQLRGFIQAVKLNPTIPVMDPNNPLRFNTLTGFDTYNPVQALRTLSSGADVTYSVVDVTARLNLLKNLSTEVKLGRQGRSRDYRYYSSSQSATSVQTGRTGEAGLGSSEQTTYIFEWLNHYNLNIDRHDLTALAGYSYQQLGDRGFYGRERGSLPMRSPTTTWVPGNTRTKKAAWAWAQAGRRKKYCVPGPGQLRFRRHVFPDGFGALRRQHQVWRQQQVGAPSRRLRPHGGFPSCLPGRHQCIMT
jgi:hypothetical protein